MTEESCDGWDHAGPGPRMGRWDTAALFVCHSLSTERRTLGPSLNVFSILNTFPECLTGLPLLQRSLIWDHSWYLSLLVLLFMLSCDLSNSNCKSGEPDRLVQLSHLVEQTLERPRLCILHHNLQKPRRWQWDEEAGWRMKSPPPHSTWPHVSGRHAAPRAVTAAS